MLRDNKVDSTTMAGPKATPSAEMTYHVLLVSPLTFQVRLPRGTKIKAVEKKEYAGI